METLLHLPFFYIYIEIDIELKLWTLIQDTLLCTKPWTSLIQYFPRSFCNLHLPANDATIILEDEAGHEYRTTFLVNRSGLSVGWRKFSLDHQLEVGDILVFLLVRPEKFKVAVNFLVIWIYKSFVSISVSAVVNYLLIFLDWLIGKGHSVPWKMMWLSCKRLLHADGAESLA